MMLAVAVAACAISGRVLDERGHGVASVQVSAQWALPPSSVGAANSDADGRFCIERLPEGTFLLSLSMAQAPSTGVCKQGWDWEPVDRPYVRTGSSVNVRVRRVPTYCLAGEVRDRNGELVREAQFTLFLRPGSMSVRAQDGTFQISGLRPGLYTLLTGRTTRHVRLANRHLRGYVLRLR